MVEGITKLEELLQAASEAPMPGSGRHVGAAYEADGLVSMQHALVAGNALEAVQATSDPSDHATALWWVAIAHQAAAAAWQACSWESQDADQRTEPHKLLDDLLIMRVDAAKKASEEAIEATREADKNPVNVQAVITIASNGVMWAASMDTTS
jgi:hypothetical protein